MVAIGSMRWLLLDEVLAIEKSRLARTRSRVPQAPVSAELLMVEMMAQTGALLLGAEKDFEEDLIFAKIESADFSKDWQIGEGLEIKATSDNLRPEGAWFDGIVSGARGQLVARGRFLLMNVGRLSPDEKKPVTFHEAFMNHFQVREKVQ